MNVLSRVTRKTLLKNRTRTVVTVIGVILSVAMVTAITTFISSMHDYLLRSTAAVEGDWQAAVAYQPYAQAKTLMTHGAVKEAGLIYPLGYSRLEGGANASKPFLYVQALDAAAFSMRGVLPIEGRMPENDRELLIAEHISTNGGVSYRIGQTLTLAVGNRVYEADGTIAMGNVRFSPEDTPEYFAERETLTYTVVGICPRPDLESYSAGGYSVFTKLDPSAVKDAFLVDVQLKMNRPAAVFETMPKLADEAVIQYHSSLLRYMGVSNNDNFNAVLYSMAGILIALVMVGSISLIYNAFAISVSERSRQFGMLSSAGATSKQIRGSVFYEALVISGIGIPLGLLSGMGGIGITLRFLGRFIIGSGVLAAPGSDLDFRLTVSVPALVIAAAVGLVTVLISAWIPARRAARLSAIDAIRQTQDIRLGARQVKTSFIVRRLFGMEGDLAMKNFKRNRRRYRATVFSLFISVVLFISVSTYTGMLKQSVGVMYADSNYDIQVNAPSSKSDKETTETFLKSLRKLNSVKQASMVWTGYGGFYLASSGEVTDAFWNVVEASNSRFDIHEDTDSLPPEKRNRLERDEDGDFIEMYMNLVVADDGEYDRYLRELGLNREDYTDPASPRAIVVDRFLDMNREGRYVDGHVLPHDRPLTLSLRSKAFNDDTEEPRTASITLSHFADKAPMGVQEQSGSHPSSMISLVVSREVVEQCFADFGEPRPLFAVSSDNPGQAEKDINTLIKSTGVGYDCYNHSADAQQNRSTLLVINVLSYGFIILISLITIANVFNTISTNVGLRRREFAMLKSVGMTPRGFDRMMNFECIFYGLKALLYGIPISLAVSWYIRGVLSRGVVSAYSLPWVSIGIAVLSVFLVVFVTMMYAMSKIRRENIMDALKNENL